MEKKKTTQNIPRAKVEHQDYLVGEHLVEVERRVKEDEEEKKDDAI